MLQIHMTKFLFLAFFWPRQILIFWPGQILIKAVQCPQNRRSSKKVKRMRLTIATLLIWFLSDIITFITNHDQMCLFCTKIRVNLFNLLETFCGAF